MTSRFSETVTEPKKEQMRSGMGKELPQLSKNRFKKGDNFTNLTFVVEEQKLHVNKVFLMIHSPVLHKMFTSDFKEKDLREIQLPGKKYSAMVELLEQIYPGDTIDLIKDESIEELLQLADEYDVRQVFTNTRHYINRYLCGKCAGTEPSTDRILFYLGLVERFQQLSSLRQRLVGLASQIPARKMEESKYFLSVPATATRDALLQQIKAKTW